jgi:hypothetical protein
MVERESIVAYAIPSKWGHAGKFAKRASTNPKTDKAKNDE